MGERLEPQPAAVTVVSGFLGAGKTTLLGHLVRALEDVPTAVVVNDFGPVVLDRAQVVGVEDGVVELANGCLCCSLRNGTTSTLLALLERPRPPRHVFIETSGIADPRPVAQSLLELGRLGGVRLDAVLVVVDAENFAPTSEHRPLLLAQLAAADVVVLSKLDLVPPERRVEVRRQILALEPGVRLVEAVEGRVPLELVIAVEADTARQRGLPVLALGSEEGDPQHHHGPGEAAHGFARHTFSADRPLSWARLAPALHRLPGVYRVKGVLALEERPGDRLILHKVGRRTYVRTVEPWGEERPHSELVLIGPAATLDHAAIEVELAACLS